MHRTEQRSLNHFHGNFLHATTYRYKIGICANTQFKNMRKVIRNKHIPTKQ